MPPPSAETLRALHATRTVAEIAALTGRSVGATHRALHAAGIPPRRPGPRTTPAVAAAEALMHDRFTIDVARGHVGRTVLASRIRALADAERSGDPHALHAALVDLGAASVAWAHDLTRGDT